MPSLNLHTVRVVPPRPARASAIVDGRECYQTAWWRQAREQKLREQPLCEICLQHDRVEPATDVHHIIPFADKGREWRLFAFDYNNLQCLCEQCHHAIHNNNNEQQ